MDVLIYNRGRLSFMKGVRGCGEMKRDVAIIFLCYIKTIYFLVHCYVCST